MLMDCVMDLVCAEDEESKERAYKNLGKLGVDRRTADLLAEEFKTASR